MSAVIAQLDVSSRFLAHLTEGNRIGELAADRVRRVEAETADRLAPVLLKLGLLSETDLADEIARFRGFERVASDVALERVSTPGCEFSEAFFRSHEVIPIACADDQITFACWDGLDEYALRALEFASERPVLWKVGTQTQLRVALESVDSRAGSDVAGLASTAEDEEIERLKDLASEAPVIRLVQRVLDDAVAHKASDIHFESSEQGLHVRLRMDGLLRDMAEYPKELAASVISRLKIMAGMNIAERRLPQDGRIRVTIRGKDIDFRMASGPTLYGETVVLRILDRQDVALDFDALGFDARLKQILRDAIERPHGVVLVTGPTGSGKTTTLYAALKEINSPTKKILTVEDPVEYVLKGVNQVPIRPQIGLSFANALRSFLRQDPDVMMVGEIRDRETAEISIQAALTGHLLLSTLHTNTAAAAITRLLDMGIDDYLLTSTLNLIVGQRLVRKLCLHCRAPYEPSSEARERFGLGSSNGLIWYRAIGCAECRSGYHGRTTIIEAMTMSDGVRAAVLDRADAHRIEQVAVTEGMRTLFRHGVERVNAGLTTAEEVLRVTNLA